MRRYAFVVNPASGRGRARARARALAEALGVSATIEVLETSGRGSASELAAQAAPRVERMIAVGGDGTLHEVLNGLMRAGFDAAELPALGFLPAGTANAASRALGLTSDPRSMAHGLAAITGTPIDVGLVRHEGGATAFLLWFGAGLDAVVIHSLNATRTGRMGFGGLLARGPRVLRDLAAYDQPVIESTVDGTPFGPHGSVTVANVGTIAFGGKLAPGVDPSDGRLDVVGVPPASLLGTARHAVRMLTSNLAASGEVQHVTGRRITLRAEGRVPFQVDGEAAGVLPAEVTVRSGAVRLLLTR
jgi:diacylglycerol kinase family enzyme